MRENAVLVEKSFADAIAIIAASDELSEEKRRHWATSLRQIANPGPLQRGAGGPLQPAWGAGGAHGQDPAEPQEQRQKRPSVSRQGKRGAGAWRAIVGGMGGVDRKN
jgi:hypothetical protein